MTLEVVEGPMDGAVVAGRFATVRIGRSSANDLVLSLDKSVSGEHAIVEWDAKAKTWMLTDCDSTNGTWTEAGRLSSPQPIQPTVDFVTGHAVIRCREGADREPFVPDRHTLVDEIRDLVAALAADAASIYGAAVAIAIGEGCLYLSSRHLLRSALVMRPDLLIDASANRAVTLRMLSDKLRAVSQWTGGKGWIGQLLQAASWTGEAFCEGDIALTPRVLWALRRCHALANEAGAEPRASYLIRAIIDDHDERLLATVTEAGLDVAAIIANLDSKAVEIETTHHTARRETPVPSAPVAATPAAAAPGVSFSSGDPAIDLRAREAVQGLYAIAALYHLASPEERRAALKAFVTQEVATLEADKRTAMLNQLRTFFPVEAGSAVETTEVFRLQRQVAHLQRLLSQLEREPDRPAPMTTAWKLILEGKAPARPADTDAESGVALELIADIYGFATSVESFVVGMVHNLVTSGGGTDVVELPGFRTSLARIGRKLVAGEPVRREDVQRYLQAVERWLVVVTAAYHEGPKAWFEEFWDRASPAAVEDHFSDAGWRKRLGMESIEYWSYFKELVQAINPELVADEIQRIVRRRAEDHFARLEEGRNRK